MSFKRKEIDYNSHFKQIKETLSSLFYHSRTTEILSGLDIYHLIYDLCNAKPKSFTDRLFRDIARFIDLHLMETCQSIISQPDSLSTYAKAYQFFERAMRRIDILCDYLNRMTSGPDALPRTVGKYKKQPIYTLGLSLWKKNVLVNIKENHHDRLLKQWIEIYQKENQIGEYTSSVKTMIDSLIDVNADQHRFHLYLAYFEIPFLENMKLFHEKRAANDSTTGDMIEFMTKATFTIEEESLKAQHYAHPTSYPNIMKIVETKYIVHYSHAIIESFKEMLKSNNERGCRLAYGLLSRTTDGLNYLMMLYHDYILKLGKTILLDLSQQQQQQQSSQLKNASLYYVENLLYLHEQYTYFNRHVFFSNTQFHATLDKAFHTIMNDESMNYKPAELLAYYTDILLKKSSSKLYLDTSTLLKYKFSHQLEETEEHEGIGKNGQEKVFKVVTLFKYINDKDIFQKHYQKSLTKRLVYNTYNSIDNEAQMIQLFKQECGSEYTSKFYKMLSDKELGKDLTLEYNKSKQGMEFDAQILTSSAWPLHQQQHINHVIIPTEFLNEITKFKSFYDKKYNGRKLDWQWHLSRVEMRLLYLTKPYEIQISFYQSVILLLFNNQETLSLNHLIEETGLTKDSIVQHIKPIVDSRILTCGDDTLNEDSILTVNFSFKSKRVKIKLSTTSTTVKSDNNNAALEEEQESIDMDRVMYVQAAIIRIMKSRQNANHNDLIRQVMEQQSQLKFKPTVPMIKKCIEQLIEKDFLKRKEKEKNVYEYIA